MGKLKITIGNRRILSGQYGYFPYMTKLSDGQILVTFATGEDDLPTDFEVQEYRTEKPFVNKSAFQYLEENKLALANPLRTCDTAYWTIRSLDGGKTFEDYGMPFCMCVSEISDGSVIGISRLGIDNKDGTFIKIYRSSDMAASWSGPEYVPVLGQPLSMDKTIPYIIFHRSIKTTPDGAVLISAYTRFKGDTKDRVVVYRTDDNFKTLYYYSTAVCDPKNESPHGINESVIEYTSDNRLVCVSRTNGYLPMVYTISKNDGATWSDYHYIGSEGVDPDMVRMSNGLLACSYGRPGVFIMFSEDGEVWTDRTCVYHHPYQSFGLSYREKWDCEHTCGYTSIREVSPGKLLLTYSAPAIPNDSLKSYSPLDSKQRLDFRIWGVDITIE